MTDPTGYEEPPGWHRLSREARHRTEGYWLGSRLGSVTVVVSVTTNAYAAFAHIPGDSVPWRQAASTTAFAVFSFIQHRRWSARATWLAATPRWWERQDEMPTILPFPRLSGWMVARMERADRRLAKSSVVRRFTRAAR